MRRLVYPLAWIASLAACADDGGATIVDGTRGAAPVECEDGKLQGELGLFSFPNGRQAVAERSVAGQYALYPAGTELPPLALTSDAPSVAEFSFEANLGGPNIAIAGHVAGRARLQLLSDTGALIDAASFTVDRAAAVSDDRPNGVLVMRGGVSDPVTYLLVSDGGCALRGQGGVDYAFAGVLSGVAVAPAIGGASGLATSDEVVAFSTTAVGSGEVVVSTPGGLTHALSLDVVDESAVASVQLELIENVVIAGALKKATLAATAYTADDNRIESPQCTWTIDPVDGPVELTPIDRDEALVSGRPGSATVRCEIGTAAASADVTLE